MNRRLGFDVFRVDDKTFRDRVRESWLRGELRSVGDVRDDIIRIYTLVPTSAPADTYDGQKAVLLDARIARAAEQLEHEGVIEHGHDDVYVLTEHGRELADVRETAIEASGKGHFSARIIRPAPMPHPATTASTG